MIEHRKLPSESCSGGNDGDLSEWDTNWAGTARGSKGQQHLEVTLSLKAES